MTLLITLAICLGLVLLTGLFISQMYNRLVKLKNRCDNSFAQIEVEDRGGTANITLTVYSMDNSKASVVRIESAERPTDQVLDSTGLVVADAIELAADIVPCS